MALPSNLSTRTARAADPNLTTFPVGFVDLSGTGAGPYVQVHLATDANGAPQVPALDTSVAALTKAVAGVTSQLQTTLAVTGTVTSSSAGTTGLDFSVNQPTLPPVANPTFGANGVYANFNLLKTVPATPGRIMIEVFNNSNAQVVVVRDDGTAPVGQPPVNATVFSLSPATANGLAGGTWKSSTFKGRLQIYAPSGAAQIAVMTD